MQFLRFTPFAGPRVFQFKDPDSGYLHSAQTMPDLISRIISYRTQNNLPEIEELDAVVENYLCRLPLNRSYCTEEPMKRGFMGVLKGGIALLMNMAYKSYATQEEADRRGSICVKCPHNVFPDRGPFIKWSDEIAEKSIGERRSKYHDELGNCEVCSCPMRAKVFHPGPLSFPKVQLVEMKRVGCWQPELVKGNDSKKE